MRTKNLINSCQLLALLLTFDHRHGNFLFLQSGRINFFPVLRGAIKTLARKVQYSIGAIQETFSFELNSSLPVDGVTLKGRVDTFMAALQ
jgi:hypothetical protein